MPRAVNETSPMSVSDGDEGATGHVNDHDLLRFHPRWMIHWSRDRGHGHGGDYGDRDRDHGDRVHGCVCHLKSFLVWCVLELYH